MNRVNWTGGIAIVDDERVIVEFYRKVFERMFIPIAYLAYDGEDAVIKFSESSPKPQVVLMDYRMPGMDGVEAAKRILALDPDVKIVFITADSNARDAALKAGASAFIHKPVSIKEIAVQIEYLMKDEYRQHRT